MLADPKQRDRLRTEMGPRAASWQDMWLTNFRKPANHRFEGRSIAQAADMLDKDPIDAALDHPWSTSSVGDDGIDIDLRI